MENVTLSQKYLNNLNPQQLELIGSQIGYPGQIVPGTYDAGDNFTKNLVNTGLIPNPINPIKNDDSGNTGGAGLLDPKIGALAPFINQATQILDSVYASTSEPTQREKDINMGRAALKFFTTLGAQSSVPGATALGAANQAGALVAQDYLNAETKRESDAKKLAQAKKSGALSLGMQLKSAKDAQKLAKLKIKPDYINIYKTDKDAQGEKVLNVIKGSEDYIKKTSPGGGYVTDKPSAEKAPAVYEDEYGEKRFLTGPNQGELVSDVFNAKKVQNNQNIDGETENQDETVSTDKPQLKRLNKVEMGYVKNYRAEIEKLTKDFRDIQSGYQKIVKFYNTKGSIGDYGLAVQFAKLIDPGSVAREGEVAAVQRSGSITDRVKADIINALNGRGNLPPRTRAGIYNRAIEIFNTERVKAVDIINKFKGFLSSDLGDNNQGGRLDFFTVDAQVPLDKLIDLNSLPEKDINFVYDENKIKNMTIKELTNIVSTQNLNIDQLNFINNLVKKKKKVN
tara:strand:- start:49 stop:1578 length:1530 start_codon:yes stop_codon:yes gene_type:complete